jgi:phospholipid/cholesterol/gamma-HCH transport system permease protein
VGDDVTAGRPGRRGGLVRGVAALGAGVLRVVDHTGSVAVLLLDALRWIVRAMREKRVRLGKAAIASQVVRVGVRSIGIISLVSASVGLILALQMAPPLDKLGQKEMVANIIGVAVLRELGPLIAAIVLTGFAGAAIAAEIGTMVVSEEIEALRAHALNPVRFLVVPRVIAATVSMTGLAVLSDAVALGSALLTSLIVLEIPADTFLDGVLRQVSLRDFTTGIVKGCVFGVLIGSIACANGLQVTGGAAGVGRATTATVVESVVAIIIADLAFTAIFYALGLV